MTCMFTNLGGGATMIACSRGSSRKVECAFCKSRTAELLCDAPLRGAKAGKTCDGRMCRACASNVDGLDLCPPHKRERDKQAAAADDWLDNIAAVPEDLAASPAAEPPPKTRHAFVPVVHGDWCSKCGAAAEDHVDSDALAAMFPKWSREWSDNSEPPVNAIAGEIREHEPTACGSESDFVAVVGGLLKSEDERLAEAARAFAPKQVVETNTYGCTPCPNCKGDHRWPTRHCTIVCDDCGFIQTSGEMPCVHCLGLHELRNACTCGGIVCLDCCHCDAREEPPLDERKSVDATYVEHARAGYLETQTIGAKVAHVLAAPQSRQHGCHWPNCTMQVPPPRWGCREHWYTLPKRIRDRIWNTYRVGQEKTLTPSREYLDAADEAQAWIREHLAALRPVVETPRKSFEQAAREARERAEVRRRNPKTCPYCGEPLTFRHDSVCKQHPDPAAQGDANDWTGGMSESEFDPDINS